MEGTSILPPQSHVPNRHIDVSDVTRLTAFVCGLEVHSIHFVRYLHTHYEFSICLNLKTPVTLLRCHRWVCFCSGVTPRSLMVGDGRLGLYASCVLPSVIILSIPLWHVNVAKFTFGPLWHVLIRPQWIASDLYSVGIVIRIAGNELAIWPEWREDPRWGKVNRSRDIWRRSILGTCFWGHSIVFHCLNGTVCIYVPPDSTCIAVALPAFTLHFRRNDFHPSVPPER